MILRVKRARLISNFRAKNQHGFWPFQAYYLKTLTWKNYPETFYVDFQTLTVFENHRKSFIQHCERSELRLHFEWTKVN